MEITDEREKFEAWVLREWRYPFWIDRADKDAQDDRLTYCEGRTRDAWNGWQARAALEKDTYERRVKDLAPEIGMARAVSRAALASQPVRSILQDALGSFRITQTVEDYPADHWSRRATDMLAAPQPALPVVLEGWQLVPRKGNTKLWLKFPGGQVCLNNVANDRGPIVRDTMSAAIVNFLAAAPQPGNAPIKQENSND